MQQPTTTLTFLHNFDVFDKYKVIGNYRAKPEVDENWNDPYLPILPLHYTLRKVYPNGKVEEDFGDARASFDIEANSVFYEIPDENPELYRRLGGPGIVIVGEESLYEFFRKRGYNIGGNPRAVIDYFIQRMSRTETEEEREERMRREKSYETPEQRQQRRELRRQEERLIKARRL